MTKNIAIFCDGTWNKSDAPAPTNVVRLAQAVRNTQPKGQERAQVVIYVEGVGTGRGAGKLAKFMDRNLGGMFGWGLLENIKEAYRAIIFNYEPGDQIFLFGFSRGAYTARSLAGLIRKAGILPRDKVHLIACVHCLIVNKACAPLGPSRVDALCQDANVFVEEGTYEVLRH